ncbi:MAG: hypothetical protein COA67_12410 [Lutibacter sp.]|nr:MAG: hypothetical protein COA67_12410 [Lutibacter sp.]
MKKFLIKISFIIIPVIIFLEVVEYTVRKQDNSVLKIKRDYIENNNENIEGLIFGSSTLLQGINPAILKMNTASLAIAGNDVNSGVVLFNAVKEQLKLKFIIFELSNGYLGKKNPKGSLRSKKAPFYFNTPKKEVKDFFLARYPLKKQLLNKKNRLSSYNKWGFDTKVKTTDFDRFHYNDSIILKSEQMLNVLKYHNVINANNYIFNINLLHELIEICKNENIKVVFVSPPKYHLYNNVLIDEHSSRRKEFLEDVIDNKNVFFWNYERTYENDSQSFSDLIHLNLDGAQLFSEKINQELIKIQ